MAPQKETKSEHIFSQDIIILQETNSAALSATKKISIKIRKKKRADAIGSGHGEQRVNVTILYVCLKCFKIIDLKAQ